MLFVNEPRDLFLFVEVIVIIVHVFFVLQHHLYLNNKKELKIHRHIAQLLRLILSCSPFFLLNLLVALCLWKVIL